MKIYVEMRYTIAVDVDPETYDVTDRFDLAEACANDSDFWEALPSGPKPRPFYESDWEVVTDPDQMADLDGERAFHQISVSYFPLGK